MESMGWVSDMLHEYILKRYNEIIDSGKDDEIIKREIEKLNEKISEDNFISVYKEMLDKISDDTFEFFKTTMFQKIYETQAEVNEFLARMQQLWGKALVSFKSLYIICLEAAERYGEYLEKTNREDKETNKFLYYVLRALHGRACQQFLEIYCLISNGFADGAYARWRSLYELVVIATFISENGEDVAIAYMNSYGKDDRKNSWAKSAQCFSNLPKKAAVTFEMIKNNISMKNELWRKHYSLSNKIVHSSADGTFGRLSSLDMNVIPAGRSNYGIEVPAEHAAIMLAIITTEFLNIIPNDDSIIQTKIINKWLDVIREEFFSVADGFIEK